MQLFISSPVVRAIALGADPSSDGADLGAPNYKLSGRGVVVNLGEIAAVIESASKGYHFDVLDKIISSVVDCGFGVRVSYNGESIRLSKSHELIIEQRWADLARDALRYILTLGFVAIDVGPLASADEDVSAAATSLGEASANSEPAQRLRDPAPVYEPTVIPPELIRVHFVQSAAKPRKTYWVEERSTGKVLNCILWVDRAPNPIGKLTSCGAALIEDQIFCEHTTADALGANYIRSHPVYPFEHTTTGIARQDPSNTDSYFPGDVDAQHAKTFSHISERERSATEEAMHSAHNSVNSLLEQAAADPLLPPMPNAIRNNTQFLRPLIVPPNMRLVTAPVPQLNPHYTFEVEKFQRRVRGAYKITEETMDPRHGQKLAASSDKNNEEWKERIKTMQGTLVPLIADCFRRVHKTLIGEFAIGTAKRAIEARIKIVDEIARLERQKLAERQEQAAATVPNPADWTPADPLPEPPRSAAEQARRYRKRLQAAGDIPRDDYDPEDRVEDAEDLQDAPEVAKIITNENGEKQLDETVSSLRRLVTTMMTAGDEHPEKIITSMDIVVEFNNLPNVTLEQLEAFYRAGIIDQFEYAKQVARITGISEDHFITTPERASEVALQIRDVAEKSAPRPPPEGETSQGASPAGSRSKSARK